MAIQKKGGLPVSLPGDNPISTSLAESDYQGWCAWLDDGTVILEAVANPRGRLPLMAGGVELPTRREGRNVLDWKNLPHQRVTQLELYFFRKKYQQPCVRISTPPGWSHVRWLQYKAAGIVIPTAGNSSPERVGLYGYVPGYFDPKLMHAERYLVNRQGRDHQTIDVHPCWSRDTGGWALGPQVLGLSPADIPPEPQLTD